MSLTNLEISPWQVVWPRVVTDRRSVDDLRPAQRGGVSCTRHGICAARPWGCSLSCATKGGSVGTSIAQTIQERREQFHTLRLGEYLDRFNPALNSFARQSQSAFFRQTGDPAPAKGMSWQVLDDLRLQQAASLAYFDVFWVCAVMSACLVVLVLIMKRSVAEKGAAVGGE